MRIINPPIISLGNCDAGTPGEQKLRIGKLQPGISTQQSPFPGPRTRSPDQLMERDLMPPPFPGALTLLKSDSEIDCRWRYLATTFLCHLAMIIDSWPHTCKLHNSRTDAKVPPLSSFHDSTKLPSVGLPNLCEPSRGRRLGFRFVLAVRFGALIRPLTVSRVGDRRSTSASPE